MSVQISEIRGSAAYAAFADRSLQEEVRSVVFRKRNIVANPGKDLAAINRSRGALIEATGKVVELAKRLQSDQEGWVTSALEFGEALRPFVPAEKRGMFGEMRVEEGGDTNDEESNFYVTLRVLSSGVARELEALEGDDVASIAERVDRLSISLKVISGFIDSAERLSDDDKVICEQGSGAADTAQAHVRTREANLAILEKSDKIEEIEVLGKEINALLAEASEAVDDVVIEKLIHWLELAAEITESDEAQEALDKLRNANGLFANFNALVNDLTAIINGRGADLTEEDLAQFLFAMKQLNAGSKDFDPEKLLAVLNKEWLRQNSHEAIQLKLVKRVAEALDTVDPELRSKALQGLPLFATAAGMFIDRGTGVALGNTVRTAISPYLTEGAENGNFAALLRLVEIGAAGYVGGVEGAAAVAANLAVRQMAPAAVNDTISAASIAYLAHQTGVSLTAASQIGVFGLLALKRKHIVGRLWQDIKGLIRLIQNPSEIPGAINRLAIEAFNGVNGAYLGRRWSELTTRGFFIVSPLGHVSGGATAFAVAMAMLSWIIGNYVATRFFKPEGILSATNLKNRKLWMDMRDEIRSLKKKEKKSGAITIADLREALARRECRAEDERLFAESIQAGLTQAAIRV